MQPFAPDSCHVDSVRAAANREPRRGASKVDLLLLHYTGFVTFEDALNWLAVPESGVSCHYVIDTDGRVIQMVPEGYRAWHAGEGCWKGVVDINSCSIGIEIQNPGHERGYPDFPDAQMRSVIALSQDIVARHRIRPERVLAHSDIAPHRKIDPGEKFDWRLMREHGVGHWVEPALPELVQGLGDEPPADHIVEVQAMLRDYGYGLELTGELDRRTTQVVKAFQRHFRPARVDGVIDQSTVDTLHRLLAALDNVSAA